jgi:hypothetical protein
MVQKAIFNINKIVSTKKNKKNKKTSAKQQKTTKNNKKQPPVSFFFTNKSSFFPKKQNKTKKNLNVRDRKRALVVERDCPLVRLHREDCVAACGVGSGSGAAAVGPVDAAGRGGSNGAR